MHYKIRDAEASDHQAISHLILPLVEQFIAPQCSAEGTVKLLDSMQPQAILSNLVGDYRYWLAEDAEGLAGVVAIRGRNHLYHLFVANRAQGQRLATKLWHHALAQCLAGDAPDEFTVNASLYAEPIYRHFGFVAEQGPREHMGIIDVPMRLVLQANLAAKFR